MIYTLISDLNLNNSLIDNNINQSLNETIKSHQNRDCRILRQPLSLLTEDIIKFIKETKNDKIRAERQLAYTTLLCGLRTFFDVEKCIIEKTPDGKPYVTVKSVITDENKKYQKNEDLTCEIYSHQKNVVSSSNFNVIGDKDQKHKKLFISISHSDGAVAVSMSDEGEIGVDIQREISDEIAEKLNKRFIRNLNTSVTSFNANYYYCKIDDNEAQIIRIDLSDAEAYEFTSKWSLSEATLKLHGRGFGDLSRLDDLITISKTEIKKMNNGSFSFIVATSICR